jgi:uncharacterized protein (TIGR03437 family)
MLRILISSLFLIVLLVPRSETGVVLNAASLGNELAPGTIAMFRGSALAFRSDISTVKVNGQETEIFSASPKEVVFVVPDDTLPGPAEIVVMNSEGVIVSQADVVIATAAPGIFTVNGDGRGDGIILDADRLTTGPFDPGGGSLRLSIFATGVRHAATVSVTINGLPLKVEAIARASLAGLDQIHVLLPPELSGAGSATLIVDADGVRSNAVSLLLAGAVEERIVISQIFGGGGNSGAPYRNDFIEIFNAGNAPVNLAGWSVQYASATASAWSTTPLNPTSLLPGQYYLVQQAGGNNGAQLPTPDTTGTIAMAAGAGKVALVKSTTALTGPCPNNSQIVDVVGYGSTANCFKGSAPAPAASNTNAATRKTNGCTDTRNNSSDFALAAPSARNTSAALNRCTIAKSVLTSFANALAERRSHDFAPALRLRRFP